MALRNFLFVLTKPGLNGRNILKRNSSTIHNQLIRLDEELKESCVLEPFAKICNQYQSIYLNDLCPPLKRSFNLAAFVNRSPTLQQLLKLGVSLYDIENTNREAPKYYVSLDFENDCRKHIGLMFQNGLKEENVGKFISQFPMIFKEHIDDLQTRLNYLESKGFSKHQIAQALNNSSLILSMSTKSLDHKLGQLQIEFKLPARIIRTAVSQHPELVKLPSGQYKLVNFVLMEEFGFSPEQIHKILEKAPQVLDIVRPALIERLDIIHNTIKLSHATIVRFPDIITGPVLDIRQRYEYLKKLKRDQFSRIKPLYVPPNALYAISDENFCKTYAKTSIRDYKLFLKSY